MVLNHGFNIDLEYHRHKYVQSSTADSYPSTFGRQVVEIISKHVIVMLLAMTPTIKDTTPTVSEALFRPNLEQYISTL
jgi:hypothetical protein